jgi:hypothetical protein
MRPAIDVAVDRFDDHDAFERRGDRTFAQVTTPFEATASVVGHDGGVQVHVSVTLQSLDAAVASETVPEVVESGWFETLERRLADATTVTRDGEEPAPDVIRGEETVRVEVSFDSTTDRAVADAKAVVDFVEATWVQGLVPGYEYEGAAASLVDRARSRS